MLAQIHIEAMWPAKAPPAGFKTPLLSNPGRAHYQPLVVISLLDLPDRPDLQMVMLGSGKAEYETAMKAAEAVHKECFRWEAQP